MARRKTTVIVITALAALIVLVVVYSVGPTTPRDELCSGCRDMMEIYGDRITNRSCYILIDYDLPALRKRLWVIDPSTGEILVNSHVSHAWYSGPWVPHQFSNEPGTEKSCVGAFLTGESYQGDYGYSMRIDGLEAGVNDNARMRAIVFHPETNLRIRLLDNLPIKSKLWSLGCFMTPPDINRKIIDMAEGGAFMFVHSSAGD
jgi:hypothetical protein